LQIGWPTIFLRKAAVVRIKFILVVAFFVAFAAGMMVGMVGGRATAAPSPMHLGHSWLAEELKLTAPQQEQLREIWSNVVKEGPGGGQRWSQLDKQRDQEVRSLLTPEQLSRYDQILRDHRNRLDAMRAETRKRVEEAERRTREILTDSQRIKYDEITRKRHEHEGGHGHGLMAPPPPATESAAAAHG